MPSLKGVSTWQGSRCRLPTSLFTGSNVTGDAKPRLSERTRRRLTLLIALICLAVGGAILALRGDAGSRFAANSLIRMGLVIGALWLAWDSLRKPAKWLPAGVVIAGVIALLVVAAQPRLILVAVPALTAVITLGAIARSFRR
ncbi:MAG: hypothetical protein AAGA03_13090 [Planctomycetota bacterium]